MQKGGPGTTKDAHEAEAQKRSAEAPKTPTQQPEEKPSADSVTKEPVSAATSPPKQAEKA